MLPSVTPRAPRPAPLVEIRNLSVSYGDYPALVDVSLTLAAGECALLTGPSGCGKTTLARALCGLIPAALPGTLTGVVRVGGEEITALPLSRVAQRIGMVFQNPASQLFHLTVADEIAFGPRNLGWAERDITAAVAWALAATGLTGFEARSPAALSGGEQQRVAIAAALATRPQLLVLDEPCASLDPSGIRLLADTLRRLNATCGATLLIIEHRLADVAGLAQRVLRLERGRLVSDLPATAERPASIPCHPPASIISGDPVLTLTGIEAGYGKKTVLRGADLALHSGEIVALVGDNGAGKSTLARVAAGLLRPRAGRVTFVGGRRPRPGRDVTLLFQNPLDQLFADSVDEEVAFGPRNFGCFAPAAHERALSRLDLAELRPRSPLALSTGQQQRTALAACLALAPRVVILDEPTRGQDPAHLAQLLAYLADLTAEGAAVLLVTHDLDLARACAARIVRAQNGRIIPTSPHHPFGGPYETRHS